MSSAPLGTSAPSRSRMLDTMRAASWTPRRWIPTMMRSSVPSLSSTISSAIRRSVRSMARASRTMVWRSVMGRQYGRTPIKTEADREPCSFTHEADDFLGDGAGGFFGHIVPAASKYTTPHIRRDQAHRVEQRGADSALRAQSEYRHGELALGALAGVRDSF